ncbi:MAG: Fic family protein [bacterium]|nr:Fic family protein [bacterium]
MTQNIPKPPNWKKILEEGNFPKLLRIKELTELTKIAQREYDYWDSVKHYPLPPNITPEELWTYIKFTRMTTSESTPVVVEGNGNFSFSINRTVLQKLSFIDSNASGFLVSDGDKPTPSQIDQLVLSGITEEAIASSQLEGANTSRKVAKEMILTSRKPRTHGEQMIINNFQVMQRLMEWKNLPLSVEMIKEIQTNITKETLENSNDYGKFRTDEDNIAVVDSLTGESVFTPPKSEFVKMQLNRLIEFANTSENKDNYIHPVIKAIILHFWLAYLHPFVDGNGRTARAIFYWYLLNRQYWLFQYLSVSRVIKKSKISYDKAYIYSEIDENDMTYFMTYNLKVISQAINDFIGYYKKKMLNESKMKIVSSYLPGFNDRQVKFLIYAMKHPYNTISINQHQIINQVAYETARRDLLLLESKGYLTAVTKGKKYLYMPCIVQIEKAVGNR